MNSISDMVGVSISLLYRYNSTQLTEIDWFASDSAIKVLSLFFIDEVAKYKQCNEDGHAVNGEYADVFEEEYAEIIGNMQLQINDDEYQKYLNSIIPDMTHDGYRIP